MWSHLRREALHGLRIKSAMTRRNVQAINRVKAS